MPRLLGTIENEDWERILDQFQDGIYITNASGLTLKINKAYEEITGIRREQVIGHYMSELVESGILSNSITQKVIKAGKEVTAEQMVNGNQVFLRGLPVFEDDEISMVLTIVRDVTQINHLKNQLTETQELARRYRSRLEDLEGNKNFVAKSDKFKSAVALIHRVAKVDSTVLILGESGTGKEVLARELHEKSNRSKGPFLKVNCGAIPDNLLESELFGYEGGAFTGAKKGGHIGLFEAASKGTLFLDEIGDMPKHLQVKLLRVLQERTVTRLGSNKAIPVTTRVVSATNQDLQQMVAEKLFREDLYYRLNVVTVSIPSLRDRKEDIPGLVEFFIHKINEKYNLNKRLSPEVIRLFYEYDWPGNVRELENMIERIMVTSSSDIIRPEEVRIGWGKASSASEILHDFPEEETMPLKEALGQLERKLVLDAAKKYKTTYEMAAALQISQPSVVRKLKQYREEDYYTETQ